MRLFRDKNNCSSLNNLRNFSSYEKIFDGLTQGSPTISQESLKNLKGNPLRPSFELVAIVERTPYISSLETRVVS